MVSKRLGETTSNSGFVLCFNNAAPCSRVCACLPPVRARARLVYVRGCVYYARCYSAISHRAGVIHLDLECERFFAYKDSESVTRELLQRISQSLCFRAKPIITGEKSFPENKLSFGTAGNPLNVRVIFAL